ncbi:MAG TPA: VUT family protein [Chloroflexaceae bacterium]|nr:VUT family protein [Chloroflexaceae bacterium]
MRAPGSEAGAKSFSEAGSKHYRLVLLYLAAIIVASLLVSRYGPAASVVNTFLFIGLDLSTRDRLHELWQGRVFWARMLLLIGAGGLLSLFLGGSGRIALASCFAFILAGIADALVFRTLIHKPWLSRANGSNLVAAALDSLCFPLIAFGWPLLWGVALGQFCAKVAGVPSGRGSLHAAARSRALPQIEQGMAERPGRPHRAATLAPASAGRPPRGGRCRVVVRGNALARQKLLPVSAHAPFLPSEPVVLRGLSIGAYTRSGCAGAGGVCSRTTP